MSTARVRLPPWMSGFISSDWGQIIQEANLGTEDTFIATQYFVKKIPQVDIAAEVGLNRSTVSRRLAKILVRMEMTAKKLKL